MDHLQGYCGYNIVNEGITWWIWVFCVYIPWQLVLTLSNKIQGTGQDLNKLWDFNYMTTQNKFME